MTEFFDKLNSATKYPSIQTYHEIDPGNGILIDNTAVQFSGDVFITEKIDGTNGRIILMPDGDWFIGSREELMYASGDRIINPGLSIVQTLIPVAERLADREVNFGGGGIEVYFLEVYGHRIASSWKQYAGQGAIGYRMFDVAYVPPMVLKLPRDHISSWREQRGQVWNSEAGLSQISVSNDIPLTPRIGIVRAGELPATLPVMQEFMRAHLPISYAQLDEGAQGAPEGIVLRTADRSVIAKARFQDYRRALNPQPQRGRTKDKHS